MAGYPYQATLWLPWQIVDNQFAIFDKFVNQFMVIRVRKPNTPMPIHVRKIL